MLTLYPSNRLEDLAVLLAELIKIRPKRVLTPTTVIVPNPGMQHWLNMYLADYLGVAMNIHCPMPTRYIWDLSRKVLADGSVPKNSPFKRDILCWKIFALAQSNEFKETSFYTQVSVFWRQAKNDVEKQKRMFGFARQLADLFEQYLVFRPDWLLAWQADEKINFESDIYNEFAAWQRWFWNKVVDDFPEHPVELQLRAIDNISENKNTLPDDVYIFAISSISPIYLRFFDEISRHTQVHLFQLNPCVNYWGDAKSDLALAKIARQQSVKASLIEQDLHPLLRNLGAQGRDLNNLLLDLQHQEISAFEFKADPDIDAQQNTYDTVAHLSTLSALQNDILHYTGRKNKMPFDGSIVVHACHSPLRELQVLKDVLLDKFQQDKQLQAKDVLVMCPSIEVYSPFIHSVFSQPTTLTNSQYQTSIPVSVSDRKPIESEPLLVAFMSILGLPLSRFEATSIIDLIALPAISEKYKLSTSDIQLCAKWTKDACIAWGIDAQHVEQYLQAESLASEHTSKTTQYLHTWQWGISRLLVGLINANSDIFVNELAPINYIEGNNSLILGRFLQALEDIEHYCSLLQAPKIVTQWSDTLMAICDNQLQVGANDQFAFSLLKGAITTLKKNVVQAQHNEVVDISIVISALQNLLSIPEARSQFHTGNVTFCSMLPMRSIPFKVIAILGLNQQDFPRQDTPVEIDLMQSGRARAGDRSRRGDDSYLFLETLVSARQHLHLSYQYKQVKTNADRLPSTILQMLIEHCHGHYAPDSLPVVKHPLHPFSPLAFAKQPGYQGSYDEKWWQHMVSMQNSKGIEYSKGPFISEAKLSDTSGNIQQKASVVSPQELSRFFKASLQYFANHQLNVYFPELPLRDYAPVYQLNKTLQYSLRVKANELVKSILLEPHTSFKTQMKTLVEKYRLLLKHWMVSGELPFLIGIESALNEILLDSVAQQQCLINKTNIQRVKGKIDLCGIQLEYDFEYEADFGVNELKINRGEPAWQHIIPVWIKLLILLVHLQQSSQGKEGSFDANKLSANIYYIDDEESSTQVRQICCKRYILASDHNAYEALCNMVETFVKGNSEPIFIDLAMINQVLAFDDINQAFTSPSLKGKWEGRLEPGMNGSDFLPKQYIHFLLGDLPEFTQESLALYFKCFGVIEVLQTMNEENQSDAQEAILFDSSLSEAFASDSTLLDLPIRSQTEHH